MKLFYFDDSDTMYIESRGESIVESRELDENAILELDAAGNVCGLTFEHASEQTDLQKLTAEGIAA